MSARDARDEGMKRTKAKNRKWLVKALNRVRELDARKEWTGERIRSYIEGFAGSPSHHNMWGVLVNEAIRKKLLRPTGRWTHGKTEQSHARKIMIYRVSAAEERGRQEAELKEILGI